MAHIGRIGVKGFQSLALVFATLANFSVVHAAEAPESLGETGVQVRELSERDLILMGIAEEDFHTIQSLSYQTYQLVPTWTIPTGEQTQGSGGSPPPCPKGTAPVQSPWFNPGPVFTTSPVTVPAGCTPLNPDPNNPNNPGNPNNPTTPTTPVYYPPIITDPIPTSGGVIGNIGGSVVILEHIVNIGKSIWEFIKDGHAVVNVDMPSASALPQGVTSASELEGWEPMTKNYQIIVPGNSKQRQVEFVFRLTLWHSGSYRGVGSYIANLTVQAADYKVNWGQAFNVRARIPNEGIVNVSKSSKHPIAAAQVLVEWSRGKIWSTQGNSAVIYVRGDGQIKNLSAPDEEPEDLYPIGRGAGSRH